MHIDDIKRGLRAEIKKREKEQYATFQCNVRQMCKDVLDKLEEQESEIAELKHQRDGAFGLTNSGITLDNLNKMARKAIDRQKYKRCLAMARWCDERICRIERDYAFWQYGKDYAINFYNKWMQRWLKIAEKFKHNSTAQQGKG